MTKLALYDPPMCCSTGICGPAVDPALPRVTADLDWLKRQGIEVERYNLSQQPQAFVANPTVTAALREHGNDCLPLLLVNGEVASRGTYPTRVELAHLVGLDAVAEARAAEGRGRLGLLGPRRGDHRRVVSKLGQMLLTTEVSDGPSRKAHSKSLLHRQRRGRQDLGRQCHRRGPRRTRASGYCSSAPTRPPTSMRSSVSSWEWHRPDPGGRRTSTR